MTMAVVKTIEEVRAAVAAARASGQAIGLVPTMGALHAGHASLIRTARQETAFVVVSIFVNPTQFGPNEDYQRYPRPLEHDLEVCQREGAALVFVPEPATLYPSGYRTYVEVHELQDVLCGASRPGHFRGVCTVVLKLFQIVRPDAAYFGEKDAQQLRIIRWMVLDLNVPVQVRPCPTVREPDGLALSSRNQYLEPAQRQHATVLYRALQEARAAIRQGERDAPAVQRRLAERLAATPGAAVDYAAVVDAGTLQSVNPLHGEILVAVAVRFGATRLIDNITVTAD